MQIEHLEQYEEEENFQIKQIENELNQLEDSSKFELMRYNEFYVDKSLFIKEVFEIKSRSILITRPRRWGKSLNANMLQTFLQPNGFDYNYYQDYLNNQYNFKLGNKNRHLFEDNEQYKGLEIAKHKIYMNNYLGQYPVLYISFKDVYGSTVEDVKRKLKNIVLKVLKQHEYLYLHLMLRVISKQISRWKDQIQIEEWKQKKWLENNQIQFHNFFKDLDNFDKQMFEVREVFYNEQNSFTINIQLGQELVRLFTQEDSIENKYAESLLLLASYLSSFFKKDGSKREENNIVIIIDEYDKGQTTALMEEIQQEKSSSKYQKELKKFIIEECKNILAIFSKEEDIVRKIIVLGIEELLILSPSGSFNDIKHCPITRKDFNYCFAFNDKEINNLLVILKGKLNAIKPISNDQLKEIKRNIVEWYNGYNIFNERKYNPSSVHQYLDDLVKQWDGQYISNPYGYWVKSGTSEILFLLANKSINRHLAEKLCQLCGGDFIQLDYNQYSGISQNLQEMIASEQMITSCFLNTGYLTPAPEGYGENYYIIPNKEIKQHMIPELYQYQVSKLLKVNEKDQFTTEFLKSFRDVNNFQEYIQKILNQLELKFTLNEYYFVCLIQGIFNEADRSKKQEFRAIPEETQSYQKRTDHIFYPILEKDKSVYIHQYKINPSLEKINTTTEDAIWQVYSNFQLSKIINKIEQNKLAEILFISVRIILFTQFKTDQKWHIYIKEFNHSIDQAKQLRDIFTKKGSLLQEHQQFYSGAQETQINRRKEFLNQYKFNDIISLLEMYTNSDQSKSQVKQTSEGEEEVKYLQVPKIDKRLAKEKNKKKK